MKSIKNLALVIGLLALSGVSQAQFSSTWTLVSDYDFRGFSQSAKGPALQGSADYAFGESGFAIGAWASNVDFDIDEDVELDLYMNYVGTINDTFAWTTGFIWYDYPLGTDADGFSEAYVGFNAGSFSFKQWYSPDWLSFGEDALYTEGNYTQAIGDNFSLAFHAGYSWGDAWEDIELMDYSVTANFTAGNFTIFGKFTGTDASGADKITADVNNNEPRFLIGVATTFPWGD
jgi:uncharacterized protein (TIGR02001 family)